MTDKFITPLSAKRLVIKAENPQETGVEIFYGLNEYVSDFNAKDVELRNSGSAMDFSNNHKLVRLFLDLYPTGYQVVWLTPKVVVTEANLEMFR